MGISIIGGAPPAGAKEKRMVRFTATGSWTAPAGVTYAIAHIVPGGGGGGGNWQRAAAGNGASSSALGFSANGGRRGSQSNDTELIEGGESGLANTGNGGGGNTSRQQFGGTGTSGADGQVVVGGANVVPGTSYTITIGAGGAGGAFGGGAGGSGSVVIEFYV